MRNEMVQRTMDVLKKLKFVRIDSDSDENHSDSVKTHSED